MSLDPSIRPVINLNTLPTEADAVVPKGFKRVVPIVMSANDSYAAFAGVTIESIKQHLSPDSYYRLYFLYSSVSPERVEKLENMGNERLNVRCLDVSEEVKRFFSEFHLVNGLSEEAYYRLLIPSLFPFFEKVIYVDSDVIAFTDIAEIIPDDMGDKLIAAVKNPLGPVYRKHVGEVWGIDPDKHFNSGILVFNTPQWIAEDTARSCSALMKTAAEKKFRSNDQALLNIVCEGRVYFLHPKWNYMWHYILNVEEFNTLYKDIAAEVKDGYALLHYTTNMKPWAHPEAPLAEHFWKHARNTPFFFDVISETAAKAERDLETTKLFLESAREDIVAIRASHSYRIGSLILFIPQKLVALIKRIIGKNKPE